MAIVKPGIRNCKALFRFLMAEILRNTPIKGSFMRHGNIGCNCASESDIQYNLDFKLNFNASFTRFIAG